MSAAQQNQKHIRHTTAWDPTPSHQLLFPFVNHSEETTPLTFHPDSFGRVLTFIQGILGLVHSLVDLLLVTQDEGADEAVVQRGGAVPLRRCKAPHQEDALHTRYSDRSSS